MLISLVTCSVAFAADPISYSMNGTTVTVTVEDLNPSEETTLLVLPNDTTISQAFANTTLVHYINQTPANDKGVATFKFTAAEDASYDIYSGYATMGINDAPNKTVIDKSQQGGADTPSTPKFKFGDVNNDGQISGSDVGLIIAYTVYGTPFAFEYGMQAADVNHDGSIGGSDVGYVIAYVVRGAALPALPQQ